MKYLNNFLTSGHDFSADENLQKFRFTLLNPLMLLASILTFTNFLASIFGAINFGRIFEIATLSYVIVSIFVIVLLRKGKNYYPLVVIYFIASSLILFYFVLFTHKEDEFRLIAFFLANFITYVLMGKKQGLLLSILIMVSIFIISKNYNLELSSFAFSTFYTFFIIFTAFLYFFLSKVERDSVEFKLLNGKLKQNVKQEVQQREEQEQMLLRQYRMANMGEMMDSIAHQWRQPLMHINSVLMNMDSALEDKDKNKQYLEKKIDEVATLTTHMSQTIEDFRGLFKVEEGKTYFMLQSVIDDALALMKNSLNDIELKYSSEGSIQVPGYRSELMQVIIILLGNAIEALEMRKIKEKKLTIEIHVSNNSAIISIKDNAGGVRSKNINTIFDPYFTTKEQSGGTGLGLYIAKIIVEKKMGGEINVSNTSEGAKFTVSLAKNP
jgi:signal transduction histidine kinase